MEKEAALNRASFSVGEKGVPMQLQKLLSLVRQAVDRYNMIAEGDKIAVGVSGGKDSLTLLYALKKLSQFYPKLLRSARSVWILVMTIRILRESRNSAESWMCR